ncbi:PH domain-containing protein [Streptomyces sp. HNM0574]|uniref:PH domain-containing protein n=1 Tax=Streptomyces sp. HNM0574 TaxID=2714954 RepID=UPI00146A0EBB|nr:PH domain-containing protein [Streptomyces sp. HNM0574]NLU70526.1 PH domain-containing protein [Streptomyces sp. HNM0574]
MARIHVRPDIDAAAERLSQTIGAKREITHLPEVLWEGEDVELLATGAYGAGVGLLAMTDRRLIFLKHGVMSQRLEDFPYSRISSVQWHSGPVTGTLTVFASGNKADITGVPKADGKALSDRLRMVIAQGGAAAKSPETPASPVTGGDIAERLNTLDQLRAAGAITDAEYRERRARILDNV